MRPVSSVSESYNIPKFTGKIYYVDGDIASSGNGKTPEGAFKTIGEGIAALSIGDALSVKAATYTETGLDLNVARCEIWFEHGTVLDPASGTPLTVSGNFCRVIGSSSGEYLGGASRVDPAANETGVLVSGGFCYINGIRVQAGSTADLGFDITGDGCVFNGCRCADPLVAAFKIQGDKVKLYNCCTGGTPVDASIGFWMTNSCDKFRLDNCASQGHSTAGFQIDAGCTNGIVCDGSSGGGDGKFVNNATTGNCIFSNLHYQGDVGEYNSPIVKVINFTATGGQGGTGTQYRLFKVTGITQIIELGGQITTVLPATSSTPNLELTSSNASIDLTDSSGAPDISGVVVGGVLYRDENSTEPLKLGNPDSTPVVIESGNFRDPKVPVMCVEDDSADTYITLNLSAALASGQMIWACQYEPKSADGFVEPA